MRRLKTKLNKPKEKKESRTTTKKKKERKEKAPPRKTNILIFTCSNQVPLEV